jgi:uncharacterized membrane protein
MASAPSRVFRRSGDGLEFDRVAFFSDAIFAIALTLLAVGIGTVDIADESSSRDLLDGLWEKGPEIISFFLSFAVLGFFWIAHHRFIARLDGIDARLRLWNLLYLAFVAFLPFPTLLLGQYTENPVAVAFYALNVGAISALETVMFRHAFLAGLNRKPMPLAVANWGTLASATPVACFAISIPIAFVNPIAGIVAWALNMPVGIVLNRVKPAGADEYFD